MIDLIKERPLRRNQQDRVSLGNILESCEHVLRYCNSPSDWTKSRPPVSRTSQAN
jgi:hypothetical protein